MIKLRNEGDGGSDQDTLLISWGSPGGCWQRENGLTTDSRREMLRKFNSVREGTREIAAAGFLNTGR